MWKWFRIDLGRCGLAAALACGTAALALPAAGQGLFVVSQNNEKILEYDDSDGSFLRTFVEPIDDGFQNPGGLALHPGSAGLYVSSTGTGEIWSYTTGTGLVITPEEATGLISPGGVGFDATGANLYFLAAEMELSTGTDSVQKLVISSGNVSVVETDASANFSAVAVNGSDLYVSDTFNNEVVQYAVSGAGSGTTVISGLSLPGQILFRTATDLLVADTGTDRVLAYTFNGSSWIPDGVVLAASSGVDGPFGLALAPDGRLSVSGSFSNDVVAVDLGTLAVTTLVSPGAGGLSGAKDVAWSGSTLLVASTATNSVIYYDATGSPTGTVARGLSTPADAGMVFSPGGNLVVGSIPNNDLVEYDGSGGAVVRLFFDACPTSLASPYHVIYGPDGNVYTTCTGSNGVFHFDPSGNPLGFFVISGAGGLSTPRGLAFGPGGNLFVASGSTGEILKYDGTTGAYLGVFVDATGNGGGPIDPYGLIFHGGKLFAASFFPSEVKAYDAAMGNSPQTFVTSGSGGLNGPTALAFGPDGDLYVTSFNDDAIRRYDGASGAFVSTFVSTGLGGLDGPFDLAFDSPAGTPPSAPFVPALAPPGTAALVGLLMLLGVARLSRRRYGRLP